MRYRFYALLANLRFQVTAIHQALTQRLSPGPLCLDLRHGDSSRG
jgi:hypothetical protein